MNALTMCASSTAGRGDRLCDWGGRFQASTKRLPATRDEDIDYSEIPPISDRRLAAMVRANQYRPVKRTVTMRVDGDVLE